MSKPSARKRFTPFDDWYTQGPGCWEWQGHRNRFGYGKYRRQIASRVAWERRNGPVPEGLFVCHHCDNPACVRVDHLFLGTMEDNHRDKSAKGRVRNGFTGADPKRRAELAKAIARPGEPRRKVSDSTLEEIHALRSLGWSQARIGAKFGISQAGISWILSGKAKYAAVAR